MRFVGRVWDPDGRETGVLRGEAFPRFVDPDDLSPDDAWSPGWELSLVHLRGRIEQEGWLRAGCGLEPWSHRYVRRVEVTRRARFARPARHVAGR
jgi:hypothetical protein